MEMDCLQELAKLAICKVGTLPAGYHGLPLCIGRFSKAQWSPVIERMREILTTWKSHHLSVGGRITLIKSALFSLLIYFMSIFKCHVVVASRIENLWGKAGRIEKSSI